MNAFYDQPKLLQWIEAVILVLFGFWGGIFIIEKGYEQPAFYLLFLIFIPLSQFVFTPFFRLVGIYSYYSPMLIGYMANDRQIDLHSGGSFDHLFVMRKYKPGSDTRNHLLMYHLQGLIHLIRQIENGRIPGTVNIVGTSYFFNDRSLKRMGFDIVQPSLFYRANLYVNFMDLSWMYSVSQGKFAIPKLWNAKKASITGLGLVENKKQIEALYERMRSRTTG